ncbi:hypothetical protein [Methylobacterium sp. AMS5]|uniref:hypothetical protein n=1 Tax=Methylobacterium sp. AMS5 TaxID=925818 RepID=UPI00074FA8CE|nr:hypothetical protein [Methylobacterium sp. AMS5]AMB48228.1 hypothetical protein Y590_25000 [Methylobacterium sp. AMS5]
METVFYGAFFVCWLYWLSARIASKVDIAGGLILASIATLFGLRTVWLFIEALKAIRAGTS